MVGPDGRLTRFGTPLPVDGAFIDAAQAAGGTGRRFRFASACAEGNCTQWTGEACGLIGAIRERAERLGWDAEPVVPRCAIRATCRWWEQDGAAACAVCSRVVYDAADATGA